LKRALEAAAEGMNWRRGLFRLWTGLSLLWIAYFSWSFFSECFYLWHEPPLVCLTGDERDGIYGNLALTAFPASAWMRLLVRALSVPLAVTMVALGIAWIVQGFGRAPKSN
jgi:hypothetical protein